MSFPIYEPVKTIRIYIRYQHFNVLENTYSPVEDCFSTTLAMFKDYLKKYPGLAGAVGYGKNIRDDLKAKIVFHWTDRISNCTVEFDTAKQFIDFIKERPALAVAIGYRF